MKKFLKLKTLKVLCRGLMLLVILRVEELVEWFMKKNCKKEVKQCLELKKKSREKGINYILNGKTTLILLTVELIKKMLIYKRRYLENWIPIAKTK